MASITARKTSDGETHYKVVIRLKGTRTQTATFARKTDAVLWAQKIESAIRERRHFDNVDARRRTFAELADEFINTVVPVRYTKLHSRNTVLMHLRWWKEYFGPRLLADIKPADIAKARDKLLASSKARGNPPKSTVRGRKPVSAKAPATVGHYLSTLSVLYGTAVNEWEWLESNPVLRVRKPKKPRGRVRFLDEAERKSLLDACKDSANPFLYTIVVVALSTGARMGEIMTLKWSQVDFERKVILLMETKNGERRALPLAGHAFSLIEKLHQQRRRDTPLLFPRTDGQKPVEIRKAWNTAVRSAGVEDFRFHDLRHSAASYLAMNGATLAEISEVLGHKTLQMVKRYAHLSEQHTAKVVERMNRKIFKKMGD